MLQLLSYLCTAMTKNPLRTYLGLNCDKNKNIKAWQKNGSSYKKKKCNHLFKVRGLNEELRGITLCLKSKQTRSQNC